MKKPDDSVQRVLDALQERAKELNCLYRVDELVHQKDKPLEEIFRGVVHAIPDGWQYPSVCRARVLYQDKEFRSDDFDVTPSVQRADLTIEDQVIGGIEVYYTKEMPPADEGPFLKEERKLLNAIAERLSFLILQRRIRNTLDRYEAAVRGEESGGKREWWVIIDFLRRTDRQLLRRISRKMINYLTWSGVQEAGELLQRFGPSIEAAAGEDVDDNRPVRRADMRDALALTDRAFEIASNHLSDDETVGLIHKWIKDDKSTFLLETLENQETSLPDIGDAIDRYEHIDAKDSDLSRTTRIAMRVALIRRILTDQLDYINIAKNFLEITDFRRLKDHAIAPPRSHGKLGGKSSGLFLAEHILRRSEEHADVLREIKVPNTWYMTSDALLDFIRYNNLEDLYDRKYLDVEQVRLEYPNVVQLFKNSHFSPEIVRGLSAAIDDFGDRPLIVRSSSLLEDQMGAAFSGKYKSLFLANTGSKMERLTALVDAIAEVYASVFGPDPIEYRAERGMLDLHEEMGIMIQEVVGRRVGRYFIPAFAGVAFSNNEFRWSPRIRRADGLVRLVPGLGTRAVDRLTDDYTVLASPGQPGLRANVSADEVVRYAPKKIDVIDLEKSGFATIDVERLLRECGDEYPALKDIVSVVGEDGMLRAPDFHTDPSSDDLVVTFEGLMSRTPFMARMKTLLDVLEQRMGTPVDIEFASDGESLFLLQCRAQSYSEESAPSPIPRDVSEKNLLFSANRYISNGRVPDITHVVYVDSDHYAALGTAQQMKDVGRAVGRLNKLLPKRQFMLMGPGRWGSRGDIRLGVPVTYSEINNCAVLAEIARKKGSYSPDLSFGTHFFQDLVEASIRYLPLYPDDPGQLLNEPFLKRSRNVLPTLLPEFAQLEDVIRVIDVPEATGDKVLRILLNADLEEGVGLFVSPSRTPFSPDMPASSVEAPVEEHWRWRLRMAERIAALLDAERFGLAGLYVFGSTKNATAGPASDIDLILHFRGTEEQRAALQGWLEGWGLCLGELNYLRTGCRAESLLDLHWVTDEDIERKTSYAVKIGAVTDAARPLSLKGAVRGGGLPVGRDGAR